MASRKRKSGSRALTVPPQAKLRRCCISAAPPKSYPVSWLQLAISRSSPNRATWSSHVTSAVAFPIARLTALPAYNSLRTKPLRCSHRIHSPDAAAPAPPADVALGVARHVQTFPTPLRTKRVPLPHTTPLRSIARAGECGLRTTNSGAPALGYQRSIPPSPRRSRSKRYRKR